MVPRDYERLPSNVTSENIPVYMYINVPERLRYGISLHNLVTKETDNGMLCPKPTENKGCAIRDNDI